MAREVVRRAGRRRTLVDGASLTVQPGDLIGIAGPSGAGKSTLLELLAGVRRPDAGSVSHDGVAPDIRAGAIGYVPQDDVVHQQLPLRRSLWYTARLRLPADTPGHAVDARVDRVLQALGLDDRADVMIGALSGGQRKRASIAAELLTSPRALFLDEPTSGLDPASAADLLSHLRALVATGVTVVLTTHALHDLRSCDRVVLVANGGIVSYDGPPVDMARAHGVDDLVDMYRCLEDGRRAGPASTPAPARTGDLRPDRPTPPTRRPGPGRGRQAWLLSRRTAETLVRSRLTLAVLVGSPALVIAMMAILFRPFDDVAPSTTPVQLAFWLAFAGFFFGLTYGLLQIVVERPLLRREHLAGLDAGAYVTSKVAVLLPLLGGVTAALLGVLHVTGRLPDLGRGALVALYGVLLLESVAALALGLLASALVGDATQAVLVLPMICFPQVLFAGGVVPVDQMTVLGRWISAAMATRWSFETSGRIMGVPDLGPTGVDPVMAAFAGSSWPGVAVLAVLAAACCAGAIVAVGHRCRVR